MTIERRTVEIILEPRTKIPDWIAYQDLNVEISKMQRPGAAGPKLMVLKIKHSDAHFYPGGIVAVVMPGSENSYIAFDRLRVLEIRYGTGKSRTVKKNNYLCRRCFRLEGKMISYKPAKQVCLIDAVFICKWCNFQYELQSI